MKNKTAKQWLEIARANGADWVEKAFDNIKMQPEDSAIEKPYSSLSLTVKCGFSWSETDKDTQGHKYWQDIYNSILDSEKSIKRTE